MCMVQDRNRDSVEDVGQAEQEPSAMRLMDVFLRERECLRRVAAGMGMDRADTDDVLQDVSVRVLRYEGTFADDAGMRRWLIRTTVNGCLTEHRRRFRHKASRILKRRPDLIEGLGTHCGGAERMGLSEELEIVRGALLELDPALLSAMVLRYFCDLTSQEIAEILEWNASTVRGRLREARRILAAKLLQRGIEP